MNKTFFTVVSLLTLLLLLTSCSSEDLSSSKTSIHKSSSSEISPHLTEPDGVQNSLNINPSDIKCQEVDNFYSIHSLADDKFLIHAGKNNGETAYLITYDLASSSDTYISDFLDPILYIDIINENTYCLSTYTKSIIINNDNIINTLTLTPDKTFDYRYDFISNSLCYVDQNSNLIIENMESKSKEIVYAADFVETKNNGDFSANDKLYRIERGANPLFFNNHQLAFIKNGGNDFSPLLVYDIKNKTLNEYPADIFKYSYQIQPLNNGLVITSHEDSAQKIYIFDDNNIYIYNLGITYVLTYESQHDLLLQGTDQALYRVNLNDFTAHKLFSAHEGDTLSSATSTKNYVVILKMDDYNSSSIIILRK